MPGNTFAKRQKKLQKKDQFYTNLDVIRLCLHKARKWITQVTVVIDCSAGTNEFLQEVQRIFPHITRSKSFDIDPRSDLIIKADWLKQKSLGPSYQHGALGFNPPFGHRGTMAKRFIQHGIRICNPSLVIMILPDIISTTVFPGYIQRLRFHLPKNSFHTKDNRRFDFQCYLCVWVRADAPLSLEGHKVQAERSKELPPMLARIIPLSSHSAKLDSSKTYIVLRLTGNNAGRNGVLIMGQKYYPFRLGKLCDLGSQPIPNWMESKISVYSALELKSSSHPLPYLSSLIAKLNSYKVRREEKRPNFNHTDIYRALSP